jgi:hypothetical protein
VVEQEYPGYLAVGIDPVNFEKPMLRRLKGGVVYKTMHLTLNGKAWLAYNYPVITLPIWSLPKCW